MQVVQSPGAVYFFKRRRDERSGVVISYKNQQSFSTEDSQVREGNRNEVQLQALEYPMEQLWVLEQLWGLEHLWVLEHHLTSTYLGCGN